MSAEEAILQVTVRPEEHRDVWIYAELRHGRLSPTAFELLSIGRRLAGELGERLCAVLPGCGVERFAAELFERGADVVYALDDEALGEFVDETYARVLCRLILEEKPNKFLLPASVIGRSLASRVAVRVRSGLTADVTELSIDQAKGGALSATRPSFGGTLMATIACVHGHRPEMATVRPLAFESAPRCAGRGGLLERAKVRPEDLKVRTRHLRFEPVSKEEVDISQSQVIVAGGYGAGKDGFELIRRLASRLGGAVGASRRAVDAGWISYRHQIGLTGRVVRPRLLIAAGISGQIQHLAGMSSAGTIVCINKDPEAPLMKLAALSVEGDLKDILPALLRELEPAPAPR